MGVEVLGAFWPIPGSLVLVGYLLCIFLDIARRYSVPAFVASILTSGAFAAAQVVPLNVNVAWFYLGQFLSFFFFFGLAFAGIGHVARALARS